MFCFLLFFLFKCFSPIYFKGILKKRNKNLKKKRRENIKLSSFFFPAIYLSFHLRTGLLLLSFILRIVEAACVVVVEEEEVVVDDAAVLLLLFID